MYFIHVNTFCLLLTYLTFIYKFKKFTTIYTRRFKIPTNLYKYIYIENFERKFPIKSAVNFN